MAIANKPAAHKEAPPPEVLRKWADQDAPAPSDTVVVGSGLGSVTVQNGYSFDIRVQYTSEKGVPEVAPMIVKAGESARIGVGSGVAVSITAVGG